MTLSKLRRAEVAAEERQRVKLREARIALIEAGRRAGLSEQAISLAMSGGPCSRANLHRLAGPRSRSGAGTADGRPIRRSPGGRIASAPAQKRTGTGRVLEVFTV